MSKKYRLPDFLGNRITQEQYLNWLEAKANHIRRDRNRGNTSSTRSEYKREVHRAVEQCQGRDWYTDEWLQWELIGTYDNEASKAGRRKYKAKYALLPTVDHLGDGAGPAEFRICAWRTNDAKNDLSLPDFIELCRRVVAHCEGNFCADHRSSLEGDGTGGRDFRTSAVAVSPTPSSSPSCRRHASGMRGGQAVGARGGNPP